MRPFMILLMLLLLKLISSCGQVQNNNKSIEKIEIQTKTLSSKEIKKQHKHYLDTTLVANKQTIKFLMNDINEDEVKLTFIRNSKIIKIDTLQSVGLGGFEFIDFNKDGNSDIMFTYIGNDSSYELYLFDNLTNEFKILEGFNRFTESIQLKNNPKYYYTYQRAGCADMNWVSDLFYIDNFRTIQVGHIYGQGCDFEVKENPQVISIYKVLANDEENKQMIKKLPYLKNIPKFDDKWDFIEKYWSNNIEKFK
jgi:hypothetical protein